eukprot:gnl/Dysnectes_brevis/284_a317_3984.p1 GENE.gnl/Dysnectes_brevis/284_a317_3984~~gnl/Dysnectes_brevis/284_a317_3984.p1  ORF type:complete len:384 (-),score=165.68 gnl/Dysnectes_brevis/284_a317_3984:90-1241(-)
MDVFEYPTVSSVKFEKHIRRGVNTTPLVRMSEARKTMVKSFSKKAGTCTAALEQIDVYLSHLLSYVHWTNLAAISLQNKDKKVVINWSSYPEYRWGCPLSDGSRSEMYSPHFEVFSTLTTRAFLLFQAGIEAKEASEGDATACIDNTVRWLRQGAGIWQFLAEKVLPNLGPVSRDSPITAQPDVLKALEDAYLGWAHMHLVEKVLRQNMEAKKKGEPQRPVSAIAALSRQSVDLLNKAYFAIKTIPAYRKMGIMFRRYLRVTIAICEARLYYAMAMTYRMQAEGSPGSKSSDALFGQAVSCSAHAVEVLDKAPGMDKRAEEWMRRAYGWEFEEIQGFADDCQTKNRIMIMAEIPDVHVIERPAPRSLATPVVYECPEKVWESL